MTVLYLALACLAGVALVHYLFPASPRDWLHNLFVLTTGAGVGMGLASSAYFLCLAFAGPNRALIASVEGCLLLAALALGILTKRRGPALEWAPGPVAPLYLSAMFFAAVALAVIMFAAFAYVKPHGDWDAWSIWNLRARFFYRGGEFWKDAFSTDILWSHPEYPLFWPALVAMCWTLAGGESTAVSIAIAFLFTFGGAAILIATIGVFRGKTQAMVAATVLLGTWFYVQMGAMQFSDIPLSFYMLTAIALLCFQDRFPGDLRFSLLAGLMGGFAAWSKNEGLLFVFALIAARAFAILRFGTGSERIPQIIRLAAGSVAPVAVVALFQLRYAPGNLLGASGSEILAHALDFSRWVTAVEAHVKMVFTFGEFLLPVTLALLLYWFLVRFNVEEQFRKPILTVIGAVGLTLVGEFVGYVLLGSDLVTKLAALERTVLHVWPAALLAFFLACNPPQLVRALELSKRARK
jgi:hypothetical protein